MKNTSESAGVMTFWKHLAELRLHLVRSALAVAGFALIAFLNKDFLFSKIILAPKEPFFLTNRLFCQLSERLSMPALCINASPLQIINIDMAGQFTTHIIISLVAGIILAIPYIIWEIWRFIKPGLTPKEQANSRGAVLVISGLFLTGVLFAYFFIVPLSINFLGSYQVSAMVENQIALRSYISLVTTLSLATGLVFELPIFIYFLSRAGIVSTTTLRKNRKIAIVLLVTLSAIITPPDVVSQILVSVPLYLLFELSIAVSARAEKRALVATQQDHLD